MENDNQQQVKSFYRILEEGIAKLPADVRGALYRPCARRLCQGCRPDGTTQAIRRMRLRPRPAVYEIRTFGVFFCGRHRAGAGLRGRVSPVPLPAGRCPGSWTLRPIANAPAKASSMSWRSCCPAGTSAWKSSRPCCRAARNAVSGSLSGSSLRRLATPGRVRCTGVGRWLPAKIKIPKPMLRDFSIGYSAV